MVHVDVIHVSTLETLYCDVLQTAAYCTEYCAAVVVVVAGVVVVATTELRRFSEHMFVLGLDSVLRSVDWYRKHCRGLDPYAKV
jgi:hypothetical protein